MSYTLVLVRHGESVWNKANLFTGWTDVEGTVGETAIPVNTEGQSVKAYKKVQFLQPPDPDPAPTPVSTTALTAAPTAVPTAAPKPVPKTGDSANPVLWLGLILLGLAGISGRP